MHIPVEEVHGCCVNALKKGSTPTLQPRGERALSLSSSWPSVPRLASHWDNTGPNTELQPASHPATRCPQEMIVSVPVCTDLSTGLEQMQPLSCPAHRLCPSWPCFLMICFSIPQWKWRPFLTLRQHRVDLGGFLGCKRPSKESWEIFLVSQAFCSPSPVLHHHAAKVISFYFLTHTMFRTPKPLIQSPVKSIESLLLTWGGLWVTPYVL